MKKVDGNTIKMIALITMTLDHSASILINTYSPLYIAMRFMGRIAFVIYSYLIVEGFYHTKNKSKYGLRLLGLAIISILPFYLFKQSWYPMNTIFTLLLGYLTLCCHESINEPFLKYVLILLLILGGLFCDYSSWGVIFIYVMFLFHEKKVYFYGSLFFMFIYRLLITHNIITFLINSGIFLSIPLLYCYNGKRKRNKRLSTFFYLFYPFHFFILLLIKIMIKP